LGNNGDLVPRKPYYFIFGGGIVSEEQLLDYFEKWKQPPNVLATFAVL